MCLVPNWAPQTGKHCFPDVSRFRALETFVAETFFAFEEHKIFLNFFRNILFRKKGFLARANGETLLQKHFRNVSARVRFLVCGGLKNNSG